MFTDEIARLMFEMRSVWMLVAPIPTWITSPSFAPDWKLNAGLFGFVSAATFWAILMYDDHDFGICQSRFIIL